MFVQPRKVTDKRGMPRSRRPAPKHHRYTNDSGNQYICHHRKSLPWPGQMICRGVGRLPCSHTPLDRGARTASRTILAARPSSATPDPRFIMQGQGTRGWQEGLVRYERRLPVSKAPVHATSPIDTGPSIINTSIQANSVNESHPIAVVSVTAAFWVVPGNAVNDHPHSWIVRIETWLHPRWGGKSVFMIIDIAVPVVASSFDGTNAAVGTRTNRS